ncbi:MAG: UDP-N-acetylmuramoyl-tripeptide--D-alanyl-D-alanine ligase [Alistipes sp.]|nr:UDP-N-acetylmuramoyl-tripeptide--D-alanyl-D-alanine ligase [Candidatus Alistipes equi]
METNIYSSIDQIYRRFSETGIISTDSRQDTNHSVFFALKGSAFDGNTYAEAALEKGATYAVIDSTEVYCKSKRKERLLLVKDVLIALQDVALYHRKALSIPIIAIVGSNGKTTTKELVREVLSKKYHVKATIGNLNNAIGVPITLLGFNKDTEIGIVEMGASAQGEISTLCHIAQPDYGIITNIGRAHLEGFHGIEGIKKGKGELYDALQKDGGMAFVPKEDSTLMTMFLQRKELNGYVYSRKEWEDVPSLLSGAYNRYNIASAAAVGTFFGVERKDIYSAVEKYQPTNNRSEIFHGKENDLLIDCYNANPSSMEASIENFLSIERKRKVMILGDMKELGEWSRDEHIKILERVARSDVKRIFTVGENFLNVSHEVRFKEGTTFRNFSTIEEFIAVLPVLEFKESFIFLKGSHSIGLEKLKEIL